MTDELFDVKGRVVVVTGGSRGVGRELVLGFAAHGAHVVVASRRLEACLEVASLAREWGVDALGVACHVGRWDELEGLIDAVYERFGRMDVLVNNAGVAPVAPSMVEISEKLFDAVVGVNLKGPFRLACLAGSRMAAAGGGAIINVSSGAATRCRPRTAVYGVAKAGLNALTTALAIEYGPSVRVNTIVLGPTDTDASRGWFHTDQFRSAAEHSMALRRGADPREIVGTALYLASKASSFTTGALFPVDGGLFGELHTPESASG